MRVEGWYWLTLLLGAVAVGFLAAALHWPWVVTVLVSLAWSIFVIVLRERS